MRRSTLTFRFHPSQASAILAAAGLAVTACLPGSALATGATTTTTTSVPTGTTYGSWQQTEGWGGWSRLACDNFSTTVTTTPRCLASQTCSTTTTVSGSVGVSASGPSVTVGGSVGVTYSSTYTFPAPPVSTTSATTIYRHEYSYFNPVASVTNGTNNIAVALNTQANIRNMLGDGAMTFDGRPLALGEVLRLDTIPLGSHQWIVERSDGVNHELDVHNISLSAAYTMSDAGHGHDTVPYATARFTNNSADSVLAHFSVSTPFYGLLVDLRGDLFTVGPGQSVDVPVYFAIAPGYLAELNQPIWANVTASFPGTSDVLAATTVTAVTIPPPGAAATFLFGILLAAPRARRRES